MVYIAKVIVDVPSSQTNQPYDYLVPESFADKLAIGFRVSVPFGHRKLQGFIVDLYVGTPDMTLKPIDALLDLDPVLTTELVNLGEHLAQSLYAFKINCYKTMLPALLKADYVKYVDWLGALEDLPSLFNGQETIAYDQLDSAQIAQVLQYKKQQLVTLRYDVQNRAKHKMKTVVRLQPEADLSAVQSRAVQQQLAITLLQQQPVMALSDLGQQGVSAQAVKALVKKGIVGIEHVVDQRDPYKNRVFEQTTRLTLNAQQQAVYLRVKDTVLKQQHRTFLLQGVTGSGKTEVYLQLIEDAVGKGRTALLLVPEIALTPQMAKQFKGRFGDRVAVLHSGLSNGERYDEWVKIKNKTATIVVGARSSIFAPLENIGIIIIDEEHESTYKQMDTVRYHARDVAIWRGQYHQAPVVLGSATPSLETRARAQKNVYELLTLTQRAKQQLLPSVSVVDMTKEKKSGNLTLFSKELMQAMQAALAKKEQIVLLLNRRGYSSYLMCRSCGHVLTCPNCDISLTLHMDTREMKCHYCDHKEAIAQSCPKCFEKSMQYFGIGTQKVEEELYQLFEGIRVIRMDVDTTRKKGQHEALLSAFEQGEADVLLGTQMIAKGLDFPNITVVGVINADTSLNLPDFRAGEKTFQLLTQVAGRAGRGDKSGHVIIQTYNPKHYVITLAQYHDYEQFYRKEMQMRHMGQYAPYFFTIALTITSDREEQAAMSALRIKDMLLRQKQEDVLVIGPSTTAIARLKNKYYFQILLKYKQKAQMQVMMDELLLYAQELEKQKIYVSLDVEPLNFI